MHVDSRHSPCCVVVPPTIPELYRCSAPFFGMGRRALSDSHATACKSRCHPDHSWVWNLLPVDVVEKDQEFHPCELARFPCRRSKSYRAVPTQLRWLVSD